MKTNVGRLVAAFVSTLAIIWVVPLPIYGVFSGLEALETPDVGSPAYGRRGRDKPLHERAKRDSWPFAALMSLYRV